MLDAEDSRGLHEATREIAVLTAGFGLADGWLWKRMIAAALPRIAALKTSPRLHVSTVKCADRHDVHLGDPVESFISDVVRTAIAAQTPS